MARILMVCKGGYGDVFPMLALAQGLKRLGHEVLIAAEGHHEDAILPLQIPLIKLDSNPGIEKSSLGSRFLNRFELMQTLSPESLMNEYQTLMAVALDCDLMVGNQLAYSGLMVSKKLGKPWVFCAPSPLAFPSYRDPPFFPYIHRWQEQTRSPLLKRSYLALAKGFSRMLMASVICQQRRLGIRHIGHPRFEGMYSAHLNLLLTSPILVTPQNDWPNNTVLSGFTWFEPDFMQGTEKSLKLSAFLAAGSPPVVFAPGGSKRTHPGTFFTESIKACRMLGVRAIIIAAQRFHEQIAPAPDVLVTGYLPYSELFKNALVVVHSGGIGAIGWALRFGLPSLIVPSSWDQFDNARLARQQNVALLLAEKDYTAPAIVARLRQLLGNPGQQSLLQSFSRQLVQEDGALVACARIDSLIFELFGPKDTSVSCENLPC